MRKLSDDERRRRRLERQRKWREKNRDYLREESVRYRLENKELIQERRKSWNVNIPNKRALEAKRRANKLNATPDWLTQDMLDEIEYKYFLARDLSQITGEPHQVDHIVPLQGTDICGLHVPWNLQVLTASDNQRKSNKFGEI